MRIASARDNPKPTGGVLADDGDPLTPEGIANIIAYLEVVRSILARLFDEGYTIRNGELIPPEEETPKERVIH